MLYTGKLPVMNIATNITSTVTYVFEKCSASFLDPMSFTAKEKRNAVVQRRTSYVPEVQTKSDVRSMPESWPSLLFQTG
jgi:hypothetical protein